MLREDYVHVKMYSLIPGRDVQILPITSLCISPKSTARHWHASRSLNHYDYDVFVILVDYPVLPSSTENNVPYPLVLALGPESKAC